MALLPSQYAALKTFINADPVLSLIPNTPDGGVEIADALDVQAEPPFWVWRTKVTKKELVERTSRNATSFTWAGNGFITRSQGELECWAQLFNSTLECNPSLLNVRQAFTDIFSGVGNAAANRTHLDVVSRRRATRVEKLFATGTGADTAAGSGTMVFEGKLTYQEVQAARSS